MLKGCQFNITKNDRTQAKIFRHIRHYVELLSSTLKQMILLCESISFHTCYMIINLSTCFQCICFDTQLLAMMPRNYTLTMPKLKINPLRPVLFFCLLP